MGAHMGVGCDICGDEGVLEAIASCSRCKVSHEHVYCMRVVLKEVPSDWCCENCEQNSNILMATSNVMEDFSELFYSSPSSKHQRAQAQPSKDQSSKQKTTTEREKKIHLGKVKPLSSEEVIKLSLGSTVAPVKNSARPSTVSKKSKTSSPENTPLEANVSSFAVRASHPRRGASSQINALPQQQLVKEARGGVASPYAVPQTEHTSANLKSVIYITACDQSSYGPMPQYIWKGSMRVKNNTKFVEIEIQAHNPSRVHEKAYEFSKKMPALLNFELIDQKGIFVKLFADHLPDQRDIALYFKPSNEKRYGNYVSFLGHIQANNLALRTEIDGIELFIFASNALRPDCQKWDGSYFLWGLFHHKKVVKAAAGPLDLYADQNQDDMEIDMVGGLDVGIKDIVTHTHKPRVQTPPRDKKISGDAPPGFDNTLRLRVQTPRDKNIGGGDAPPGFDSTIRRRVQTPRDKNIGGGDAPPGFDSTIRRRVQIPRDMNIGDGDVPPGFDSTLRHRVQTPRDKNIGSSDAPPGFDSTLRRRVQTPRDTNIGGDAPPGLDNAHRHRVQTPRNKNIGGNAPSGF